MLLVFHEPRRKKEIFFLGSVFFLQFLVLFHYWDNIPIYDGGSYFRCLQEINELPDTRPYALSKYGCFGHTTYTYMFIVSWILKLFNDSVYALNALVMFFFSIATFCFYKILNVVNSSEEAREDNLLATVLFGIYPLFFSNVFHFNVDFGVLVFSMLYLYSLLKERFKWGLIFAIGAVFSKETGIFPYLFLSFSYLVFWRTGTLKEKVQLAKEKWYLFIPLVLFFILNIKLKSVLHPTDEWSKLSAGFTLKDVRKILTFGVFDFYKNAHMKAALSIFFSINYNWLLWTITFLGLGRWIYQCKKENKPFIKREVFFFSITFLFLVYGTTRWLSFLNSRYFMAGFPFILFLFFFGIRKLFEQQLLFKRITWATVILIVFISNFRSFDFVSKKFYGTFHFGQNRVYKMTSITSECCGLARDQLVYNLQYLSIHAIREKIFHDIIKDPDFVSGVANMVAINDLANFYMIRPIDGKTGRVLYRINPDKDQQVISPLIAIDEYVANNLNTIFKGKTFFNIEMPMYPSPHSDEVFQKNCKKVYSKTYSHDGQQLVLNKWVVI